MPWQVYKDGDNWCVHKKNDDGSKGERVACHGQDEAKARSQMRALYAKANASLNSAASPFFANQFRTVNHDGKEYLIVPGVPAREQVMNTYLVPAADLARSVTGWNGTPITIQHPKSNGGSANVPAPDVAIIGRFYGANWDAEHNRMTGEYWIDVDEANRYAEGQSIVTSIRNGSILETSTGYWADDEMTQGEFEGKQYKTIHRNLLPDHIAILTTAPGACSIKDGCGVNRNEGMVHNCDSNGDCDCPFKIHNERENKRRIPEYKPGFLPTEMLLPYSVNKGSRTAEQLQEMREYISRNGITAPVMIELLEDGHIKIIDGNHRVALANELFIPQVPVTVVNEDAQDVDPEILYRRWLHGEDQGYLKSNYYEDHPGRPGQVGGSLPRSAGKSSIDPPVGGGRFMFKDYVVTKDGRTGQVIGGATVDGENGVEVKFEDGSKESFLDKDLRRSPTVPAGTKQRSSDGEIAALQDIGEDTSLPTPERKKAFEDYRTLKDIQGKKYADGSPMQKTIDDLIDGGAAKITRSGPRAYLGDGANKWTLTTKLERDYADYRLRHPRQNALIWQNKFEDHRGRPGKVGGSLPKSAGTGPTKQKSVVDIIRDFIVPPQSYEEIMMAGRARESKARRGMLGKEEAPLEQEEWRAPEWIDKFRKHGVGSIEIRDEFGKVESATNDPYHTEYTFSVATYMQEHGIEDFGDQDNTIIHYKNGQYVLTYTRKPKKSKRNSVHSRSSGMIHAALKKLQRRENMNLAELKNFLQGKGIVMNVEAVGDDVVFEVEETPKDNTPSLSADEIAALKALAGLAPKLNEQLIKNLEAVPTVLEFAQNAVSQAEKEKKDLISIIKMNEAITFSDDDLQKMDFAMLQKLNAMSGVNYAGVAGGQLLFGNEDVLVTPSTLTSWKPAKE